MPDEPATSTGRWSALAAANVLGVWGYIALLVHKEPSWLAVMLPVSALLIAIQVPLLQHTRSGLLRVVVMYTFMLMFLFLSGLILSWNESVGGRVPGSWSGRLDGGARMAIFGQVFGLPGLVPIAVVNLLLLRATRRERT